MELLQFIHLYQDKLWSTNLGTVNEEIIVHEFDKRDGINGYAVIKKKKLSFLPFYSLRITFGPVIDFTSYEQIKKMLLQLRVISEEHKALYVEFNPFVWDLDLNKFNQIATSNDFKQSHDYIYKNSIIIDLSLTEDEIFKQFERRGQKAIRQAAERGVEVKRVEIDADNFDILYKLYKNTCSRTSFIPENYEVMKKQMLFWASKNKAYLFFAYINSNIVGALLLFNNMGSVTTVYQGNDYDSDIMNKRPANAMYWESLKWAKAYGFKYYDFGGITVDNSTGDEKKDGIYNFKTQFGGRIIALPGNYRYVNRPLITSIINRLLPIYSKIALRSAKNKRYAGN